MVKEFSLSKSERLSGRKTISRLYETGHSIHVPPLRIIYQAEACEPYLSTLAVSVPKRLHKKSVDRNLLKRRIREAYRLNKTGLSALLQQNRRSLKLLIQYQHKEIQNFKAIEAALLSGLSKLAEQVK